MDSPAMDHDHSERFPHHRSPRERKPELTDPVPDHRLDAVFGDLTADFRGASDRRGFEVVRL